VVVCTQDHEAGFTGAHHDENADAQMAQEPDLAAKWNIGAPALPEARESQAYNDGTIVRCLLTNSAAHPPAEPQNSKSTETHGGATR
jgi:hypothetical protein